MWEPLTELNNILKMLTDVDLTKLRTDSANDHRTVAKLLLLLLRV